MRSTSAAASAADSPCSSRVPSPAAGNPLAVAHPQQQQHAFAAKTASGEQQRLARWHIEPVRIVHDDEDGDSSAAAARRLSVAAATANRSPGAGGPSASAPDSAASWGPGIRPSRCRTGRSSSERPANASSDSASGERARNTWKSTAAAAACSSSLVFPMPGSPWRSNAALSPPRARAIRRSSRDRSSSRPTSTGQIIIGAATGKKYYRGPNLGKSPIARSPPRCFSEAKWLQRGGIQASSATHTRAQPTQGPECPGSFVM